MRDALSLHDVEKQAKVRHVEAHFSSRQRPFGFTEGFPCIFHIVLCRLPKIMRTSFYEPGKAMDATEKILRAFIFRLLLLVLAVFAARHLPDHGLRTASIVPVELAAATQGGCASGPLPVSHADDPVQDMLLHD
ncbi:hypothetical protein [Rhizobium sp. 2MFCol3.1]|uniref:hypothetical protein n=1 Tax=Rhizobium sp. 2MFCol3.1 TaxID=1246459 RepID=UPI0018C8E475|nr:hypothetical protein [Rhizobium sp. 2MFCol3.1]